MKDLNKIKINVPPEEKGRQAVDSLRGYVYQVYQTVLAWLELKPDEELFLEVAEDFAVASKGALKAVQVKDTEGSGAITLNSKDVKKTIQAFWNFKKSNPKKSVQICFLTTSSIGKERSPKFSLDFRGLEYWKMASLEKSDIEPIRSALSNHSWSPDLEDFIKNATAAELRDNLICKIDWIANGNNFQILREIIHEKLIYFGEQKGIPPSDSRKVFYALISKVLEVVIKPENRNLTRADFLELFEEATSVSIPISSLRKKASVHLQEQAKDDSEIRFKSSKGLETNQIPLPPKINQRKELVNNLIDQITTKQSLWLYGSSGLGKTTLALLISKEYKRDWLLCELREGDQKEISYRLRSILHDLEGRNLGGVILDDFPAVGDFLVLQLSILAAEIKRKNGVLIITSSSKPTAKILQNIGAAETPIVKVPYLSLGEVEEIIALTGGDPKKWGVIIHTYCGGGHPQLVAARVIRLAAAKWPNEELTKGFDPQKSPPDEIEFELKNIRKRLLEELSGETRKFLYRLTLIGGFFDRTLAVELGNVGEKISNAGEILDLLIGPWIETPAFNLFRLSPLLKDAGEKIYNQDTKLDLSQAIANHLVTRQPFPAVMLNTLLVHSLKAENEMGLAFISQAVTLADEDSRDALCEELFLLPLLNIKTDQYFFPKNKHLSTLLRLAQLDVALFQEKENLIGLILDAFIFETKNLEDKKLSELTLASGLVKLLVRLKLSLGPQRWLPLIEQLSELVKADERILSLTRKLNFEFEGSNNWTFDQFLFVTRAISLNNTNELESLFNEIDSIEKSRRDYFLSALGPPFYASNLMINSPWSKEHYSQNIDGLEVEKLYKRLESLSRKWGNENLVIECVYARSVMLDEYAGEPQKALAVIDQAEERIKDNYRLIRQKAHIYFEMGDHEEAIKIYNAFLEKLPKDDYLEEMFAVREAAISAAKIGDWDFSGRLFSRAREAAERFKKTDNPIGVGLLADLAISKFWAGKKEKALELIVQAQKEAEKIDPNKGNQEKYCRIIIGHTICAFETKTSLDSKIRGDFQLIPGMCSNSNPNEEILKRKPPPVLLSWYQLTKIEMNLNLTLGVKEELFKRTKNGGIASQHCFLFWNILSKAISSNDFRSFSKGLGDYISGMIFLSENNERLKSEDYTNPNLETIPHIEPRDWQERGGLEKAKDALLAFTLHALITEEKDPREALLMYFRNKAGFEEIVTPFLLSFEAKTVQSINLFDVVALNVGEYFILRKPIDPETLFRITCQFFNWLKQSNFHPVLSAKLSRELSKLWAQTLVNQKALLISPSINIPRIQAAINFNQEGLEKIARLIIATEDAVVAHLSPDMNAMVRSELP